MSDNHFQTCKTSRQEREKNSAVAMEAINFYQDHHGNDSMSTLDSAPEDSNNLLQNPVSTPEI
jgi:hypothetical protein